MVRNALVALDNEEGVMISIDNFGFSLPAPSLCDSCQHAHFVAGGSVGVGMTTGGYLEFRQRYCDAPEVVSTGTGVIHTSGRQSCEFHKVST